MIVYVESNYILEITYLQEEHASCEQLLALAESAQIKLVLPAFSPAEARLSLQGRLHRRQEFSDRVRAEIRELSRSKPYQELFSHTQPLTTALLESIESEKQRLDVALSRILGKCEVIPLQATTVQHAIGYEVRFDLSSQDAVILASIREDLEKRPAGPKVFLNRNSRDFANPDIYDELSKYDCKVVPSFKGGLGLFQSLQSRAENVAGNQEGQQAP
jgi:predicted nucleic acid-binding protein